MKLSNEAKSEEITEALKALGNIVVKINQTPGITLAKIGGNTQIGTLRFERIRSNSPIEGIIAQDNAQIDYAQVSDIEVNMDNEARARQANELISELIKAVKALREKPNDFSVVNSLTKALIDLVPTAVETLSRIPLLKNHRGL